MWHLRLRPSLKSSVANVAKSSQGVETYRSRVLGCLLMRDSTPVIHLRKTETQSRLYFRVGSPPVSERVSVWHLRSKVVKRQPYLPSFFLKIAVFDCDSDGFLIRVRIGNLDNVPRV